MARTNNKLSKAAKKKAATRHNWTLQFCWNYERMQASGFAYAMVPVMQELYDTNDEVCENLERHMQFYNSHPGASAIVMGASVALEEAYQPSMSDSIKIALMGPLASLGDTVQAILVQPLAYIISAGLAAEGSLLSIPVLLIPFILMFWARWPLFNWGYRRSAGVLEDISGESDFKLLTEAAQILGLTVIGGFVPSMIGVSLKYEYVKVIGDVEQSVRLQDTLDGILPYLLPIALVAACYVLLKKAKWTPVAVIGALAVVCFVLGALGIF